MTFRCVPLATLCIVLAVVPAALGVVGADVQEVGTSGPDAADLDREGGHEDDASAPGDYQLGFECPEGGVESGATCPYYLLDENDALAQPVLMVDPTESSLMAFNALHGGHGIHPGPEDDPPTNRSRDNGVHQPHTTFRTTDGGGTWEDMPYYAPQSVQSDDRQVYGVNNAATMDGEGRIYLASLYAYREAAGPLETPGDFQYVVGLWKAGRATEPIDYSVNNVVVPSGNDGDNVIDEIHAVAAPEADRIVVLWREAPDEGGPFLRGIATTPGGGGQWSPLGEEGPLIEPCSTATEPITHNGSIYVGCRPGPGEPVEIHRVDATDGTTTKQGEITTDLDKLRLVRRSPAGHMAFVASGLGENGTPSVELSYGVLGRNWTEPAAVGDELRLEGSQGDLLEARVTAAAVRPDTGHLHLIFMERHQQGPATSEGASEYSKVFASFRGTELMATHRFDMGQLSQGPVGATPGGENADAFSDLHDGIVVWEDPQTGEETEFVAFGDHGYVRFGQVVVENQPPPIAFVGNPVTATAAASGTSTSVLYGVAAGALSLSMVARMLYSRSETTAEVEAKD